MRSNTLLQSRSVTVRAARHTGSCAPTETELFLSWIWLPESIDCPRGFFFPSSIVYHCAAPPEIYNFLFIHSQGRQGRK